MSHIGRDAEGWYYIKAGFEPNRYMRSPICPIDGSTLQTWADTMIKAVEDATNRGFGETWEGKPYDLENFLADKLVGDLPSNFDKYQKVLELMGQNPKYEQVMTAFRDKYGKVFLPVTLDMLKLYMEREANLHKQDMGQ
jgi:hypothetical protein